jgi:RHS repeat-associated protein
VRKLLEQVTAMPAKWRKAMVALVMGATTLGSAPTSAGTITYYHNDVAGSPVVATDASGHVVWRESYRPYGERLTNSAASKGNDVWFTSRRQDPETGLVYMGARYYDPVAGRFTSLDPKGLDESNPLSFGRYTYANDNPYRFVDPDGRMSIPMFVGGVLLAAGTVYIVSNSQQQAAMRQSMSQLGNALSHLIFNENSSNQEPVRDVVIPSDKYPESAEHIRDAQGNGQPSVLTVDRKGAKDRRGEALSDHDPVPGKDRDEYPPAMFGEGGKGASVRPISPSDNRGAGACIGAQCRDLPDGSRVRIVPR